MEINDENPFGDPIMYNSTNVERPAAAAVIDATTAQINVPNNGEQLLSSTSTSTSTSKVPTGFMEQVQRMDSHSVRIVDESQSSNNREMGNAGATSSGTTNVHSNNWPPLPDFCCWKPCFYHDITIDIRPEFQTIVYQLYYLWLSHSLLFSSVIFVYLFDHLYKNCIQALVGAIFMTVLSFLLWYRPIYKAFRDDSSVNFIIYFLAFSVQIMICVYQAMYWIGEMVLDNDNLIPYVLILLMVSAFVTISCFDVYMILKIHGIYTSTGANIQRARDEFMQNEQVRNFATNTLASAINSQFQQSNRY